MDIQAEYPLLNDDLVFMYRAACLILWLCSPQRFSLLGKAWFVIFFSKLALMKYLAVWCLSVSRNFYSQIIVLYISVLRTLRSKNAEGGVNVV